ncbi:polymorphic toxin-type HINT domain-containing protein [Cohnella faecalis]|uniref:Hint domain-containing protein n=1 Tax=Cohnella faecalis TaxID=2315694 RepID=A0A398CY63_9BACL|nr:polymorphic toxin-type HINT domain-containing protein [Cohnella faecalis]RIE03934.1 hypothetical protein D3H35_08190 [Cohnella faecalis]
MGELAETVDAYGNLNRSEYDFTTRKRSNYFVPAANVASFRQAPSASLKENMLESILDQWGNIVQTSVYPNWTSTTGALNQYYTYDFSGNVTSNTDAKGNMTSFAYDKLDRLVSVTDPLQQISEYKYNLLGELSAIKQGNTWTTSRTFDEAGRLITKTSASGQSEQFAPDKSGNLTAKSDLNQSVFSYQYDSNNRLKNEQVGNQEIRTFYSTPFGAGSVKWYENNGLKQFQTISYTNYGLLSSSTIISEGYIHKFTNSYDKLARTTRVEDSFDRYTRYYFDKSRIKRVQTDGSSAQYTTDSQYAEYDFYPDGKLKSVTYPKLSDGTYLKTEYVYNKLNRLTSVTNKKGSQSLSFFNYEYDNNGNMTSVTDSTGTTTYGYDALNRLTTVLRPNGDNDAYTYDVFGNRTISKQSTSGEQPAWTDSTYNFDKWNRLTSVQSGATTTNIQYGLDGLRIKKTTGSDATRYHYNAAGEVIAESNAANTVKAQYVRGPDRILAKLDKTTQTEKRYYYLYNGHGDVVQIVDTAGVVKNSYKYDEWGNIDTQSETVDNMFKYAGEMYDKETGLYYLRARYYDPSIGRFISKDSYEGDLANPLTLNLYTYVYNNPMMYLDPSGNIGWRQIDNLLMGIAASAGDTLMDMLKSPWTLMQLGKALITGDLSFVDLGKAIGASAIEPIRYLVENSKHVWGGKPTNAEVKEYGKQLGNVLQMALGSSAAMKIIAKAVPRLAKGLKAVEAASCNCFTAGTKVQTDEGEKKIEDIEVGDRVLSKDETTGEVAYKEVTATFNHETDEIYNIYVGGQTIESTFNHPFYVKDKGWTFVKDLKVGDLLVQSDGDTLKIDSIELEYKNVTVYNMTVDEFHTYFVSDLGIWVHNTACKPINLPSYKKVEIDMEHISSGHIANGSRAQQSGGKTIFPSYMNEAQVEKTVRAAYKNGSRLQTQGDRVLVRGEANGITVEMWVNTKTKTIETAYPIY